MNSVLYQIENNFWGRTEFEFEVNIVGCGVVGGSGLRIIWAQKTKAPAATVWKEAQYVENAAAAAVAGLGWL